MPLPSAKYDLPVRRRALVAVLATLAGAALLIWQIQRTGFDRISAGFAAVTWWGFLAILALSLGRFLARTVAWTTLLPGRVPLGTALAATISGDAIGSLTPLGLVVSEPAKAMYLSGPAGSARALAALAAENFFYSVSVAIYIVLGTAAMLEAFSLPVEIVRAGVIVLVIMAGLLAAAGWMAWQKPTVLSAVLSRLPIRGLDSMVERVRDFEIQMYGSVGRQGGRLGGVIACETSFHVLSFLESWLTLWLLTGQSLPIAAFVLDTFQRVVNIVFRIIPLGLGVTQVGSELVARAIGLPLAAGLTLSLVVVARRLVWAGVGVLLLLGRLRAGDARNGAMRQ